MNGSTLPTRLVAIVGLYALLVGLVLMGSKAPADLKIQFLAICTVVICAYAGFHLGLDLIQDRLLRTTKRVQGRA